MSTTRKRSIRALLLGLALLIAGTALATSAIYPLSKHCTANLSGGGHSTVCDSKCNQISGVCGPQNPTCETVGWDGDMRLCSESNKITFEQGHDNECPTDPVYPTYTCTLSDPESVSICGYEQDCVPTIGMCTWGDRKGNKPHGCSQNKP